MKNGFTLVELIVALAIIGVGVAIGAPSFSSMLVKSRIDSNSRDLAIVLSHARSEAITRNVQVTVIPSDGQWSNDWTVITDDNGNGLLDGADELIAVREAKLGVTIINADGIYSLWAAYLPNGFGIGSGGNGGGQFRICPSPSTAPLSRFVTVAATGKPKISSGGSCV